jgi:hypothetical protein
MGMVLWVRKYPKEEGGGLPSDLWALLEFKRPIDSICADAGVRKLSKFHDLSVLYEEGDVDPVYTISDPPELLETLQAVHREVVGGTGEFVHQGEDRRTDLVEELSEAMRAVSVFRDQGVQVLFSQIT